MKKHMLALALLVLPSLAQANLPFRMPDETGIRRMVADEARAQGISPRLALAVAEVESGFDPDARSLAGARGVMQIMPETARGEFGVHPDALWDPQTNIRVGVTYLRQLMDTYDGRVDIALSHYNGGSAVRQGNRLHVIPATRAYVEKVLALSGDSGNSSPRAGRMLDLNRGDYYLAAPQDVAGDVFPSGYNRTGRYLNGVSGKDSDTHFRTDSSGRLINMDTTRPVTAFRRWRQAQGIPMASVRRVPVSRHRESDGWPSVQDLRAARAVEGW
ncbi:MAG TPA: hypothetical protein DCW68_00655 [Rhodospirillaceae bacterium]|nr:MAG: hypothetical protein A2018_00950 [Alphaproteobacteria bacterium GWF2_58_20]HAU28611.1 hypothetical protein [Rhodospirillaceae bacterium]